MKVCATVAAGGDVSAAAFLLRFGQSRRDFRERGEVLVDVHEGTTFGMPHDMEWELAEEICRGSRTLVNFPNVGSPVLPSTSKNWE